MFETDDKNIVEKVEQFFCDVMDAKTEPSSSEKPNNCEHITEDGVTCAKYPACDDCLDNPLNKLKGSERLVKGSEQTDLVEDSPSLVKDLVKAFGEDGTWLERQGVYTLTLAEAKQRAVDIIESVLAKDEPTISKMEQVDEPKTQTKTQNSNLTFEKADEPQTYVINPQEPTNDDKCFECDDFFTCGGQCNKIEDEPQTDCAWK